MDASGVIRLDAEPPPPSKRHIPPGTKVRIVAGPFGGFDAIPHRYDGEGA
jgi:transcription antitermination factor NusG